jgi:DNA-binding NarL/FixJ family response regulator
MSAAEKKPVRLVPGARAGPGGAAPAVAPSQRASFWTSYPVRQGSDAVRVLVVDDDAHMRTTIAQELAADERVALTAQAGSVREGRSAIAAHAFDVLLVDLKLRDGSGFELIEYAKRKQPAAEVVVVTVMEDDESALRAFELGATGYLIKSAWFGNFAEAVIQVMNGGAAITPTLARRLLRRLDGVCYPNEKPKARERAERQKLSVREREILQLVAAGYTSFEIGKRLAISNQTVDTHLKNVFHKLEVRTRAQAVNRANDWGELYD